jgi:site-specific DNA recombinase
LRDASLRRFNVVLVYRVDRLGRSLSSLIQAHQLLSGHGVTLRSATEPFDTSTPIGTFLFQLLGSMAELEKSTILERMTLGKARTARLGKWSGGVVPIGYTLAPDGRLEPGERFIETIALCETDLVRDIFARIANGGTIVGECRRLNALGILPFRRYKRRDTVVARAWIPSRLQGMLRNPVYRGEQIYASRYGPISRAVPALVSQELWERVQAQIEKNRHRPTWNATREYLLRGLVRCGVCGNSYIGEANPKPSSHNPQKIMYYYRCSRRRIRGAPQSGCPSIRVPAEALEDFVWRQCCERIDYPQEALTEARRRLMAGREQVEDMAQSAIVLSQAIAEKKAERERVITMSRRGLITIDELEQQLSAVDAETRVLSTELDVLRSQQARSESIESHLLQLSDLLGRLRESLEERGRDPLQRREVIELLIREVRVTTIATPRGKRYTLELRCTWGE